MVMYWICIMHFFSGLRMYWICNQNVLDSPVCVFKMYLPTLMIPIHHSMKSVYKLLRPTSSTWSSPSTPILKPLAARPCSEVEQGRWCSVHQWWAMIGVSWMMWLRNVLAILPRTNIQSATSNTADPCQVNVLVNPACCEKSYWWKKRASLKQNHLKPLNSNRQ